MNIKRSLTTFMIVVSCGIYASEGNGEYRPLNTFSYKIHNYMHNRSWHRDLDQKVTYYVNVKDDTKPDIEVDLKFGKAEELFVCKGLGAKKANLWADFTYYKMRKNLLYPERGDHEDICYYGGSGFETIPLGSESTETFKDERCQTLKQYYWQAVEDNKELRKRDKWLKNIIMKQNN